jgi:hypothetical protein
MAVGFADRAGVPALCVGTIRQVPLDCWQSTAAACTSCPSMVIVCVIVWQGRPRGEVKSGPAVTAVGIAGATRPKTGLAMKAENESL